MGTPCPPYKCPVVGKFRPVAPERTESSLTLLVKLKEHVLLVELRCRRADSQLNESASVEAEPAGAFQQDLPPFVRDADGEVGFARLVHSMLQRVMHCSPMRSIS